jgi:hypothetical protein
VLPLIFLTHPRPLRMAHDFLLPGFPGSPEPGSGPGAAALEVQQQR